MSSNETLPGELLEKATRVLTPEEKRILDQEWVGKDGSKRKLEVCGSVFHLRHGILKPRTTACHGPTKTQEVVPI